MQLNAIGCRKARKAPSHFAEPIASLERPAALV